MLNDFPQWLHCPMVWGSYIFLTFVVHKPYPVATCGKVQFEWSQANPAKPAVKRDYCLPLIFLLLRFFVDGVNAHLHYSSPGWPAFGKCQADLSWVSSCQSYSMSHFTKSRCTRSFSNTSDQLLTHTEVHICLTPINQHCIINRCQLMIKCISEKPKHRHMVHTHTSMTLRP